MRILFWVPYPSQGASNRYRVEQFLPCLYGAGVQHTVRSFWSERAFRILYGNGMRLRKILYFSAGVFSRFVDILSLRKYDIVFIHRESCPLWNIFERLVSAFGKPIIFDFDDAIFIPSASKSNIFMERLKNPQTVVKTIGVSRRVIAGNSYLADFAAHYNNSVTVLPTSIDTDKYKPAVGVRRSGVVIGWIGSPTTIEFLNVLKNVFVVLSKKFPEVRFKIVGGSYAVEGLHNVESKAWSMETEDEDLESFDIGIMPMPSNAWTNGKCGFKAILYMSKGIPCIASPVGVNRDIIQDDVNGFLADGDAEWVEKLSILIERPELRRKLGTAGRRIVEERYSVKSNAPKFLEIMKDAISKESRI